MSFCTQCGASLPSPIVVNLSDQKTQSMPGGVVTNFGTNKETDTFTTNQPKFGSTFQPPQTSPTRPKSNAKIFLAIGGIGVLFLLFAVAGGAIILYNVMSKPKPTPYPTPYTTTTPTTVFSPTPVFSPNVTPGVTPSVNPAGNPSGKLDKISVDYNVAQNNQMGMRIHVMFTAYKLKGVDSYLIISFQKKDGTKLLTNNTSYRSTSGQLAVYALLTPAFDAAAYKDTVLFIPYSEFNLGSGKYNLQMDTDLIYKNGDLIQHLSFYDFNYEEK